MSPPASPGGDGAPPPRGNSHAGDEPAVPGFRSWRAVYWFVFACFVAMIIGLTIFSRVHA